MSNALRENFLWTQPLTTPLTVSKVEWQLRLQQTDKSEEIHVFYDEASLKAYVDTLPRLELIAGKGLCHVNASVLKVYRHEYFDSQDLKIEFKDIVPKKTRRKPGKRSRSK